MNQSLFGQQLSSQSQGGQQVPMRSQQAGPKKSRTIRVKVKVTLLGAAVLLIAAIISSCGTVLSSLQAETLAVVPSLSGTALPIFVGGKLAPGYDMGVNTSGGLTNWVTVENGEICMAYPSGQSWGAVFITVGKPTQPPRPGKDLSKYHQLSLELRGQVGGQSVSIGIKDKNQPDNGSETKVLVSHLTTSWRPFAFPLSKFKHADLHKLYVVIEFVFANTPETVCARNIQYLL